MRAVLLMGLLVGCASPGGTLGESCTLVAEAGCDQALTCNLSFTSRELCIEYAVYDCCEEEGRCDEAQDRDQTSAWATCADDLDAQPCEDAGTPPGSCTML